MFLLAKVIRETKNEEYSKDFFLWEKDNMRLTCRRCNSNFSSFNRRHHCRMCGSILCENCTVTNIVVDEETYERICIGCMRHETPGKKIRGDAEARISAVAKDSTEQGSAKSEDLVSHAICPSLDYGSVFEPGSLLATGSNLASAPPSSGYFEIINKSPAFCAVKVLVHPTVRIPSVTQMLYELARPSYTSLPPNELLHCDISQAMTEGTIDVLILFQNLNLMPADLNSIQYDTRKPIKVSPCANIENFTKAAVYRISCKDKNVLLKFKGENQLEPRIGSSIDRKGGILSVFGGSGKSEGKDLDFSTNVSASSIVKII